MKPFFRCDEKKINFLGKVPFKRLTICVVCAIILTVVEKDPFIFCLMVSDG